MGDYGYELIMCKQFDIAGRQIGAGLPAYIIAELSANHSQEFEKAVKTVRAAHAAGADAIKLQTYTADTITIDSEKECFRIGKGSLWEGRTLHDLYEQGFTPWEWHPKLKDLANKLGMAFFSTPFDTSAIDFLEQLQVPAYKIASFELVDLPLIRYAASMGKPLILSTGMATLAEIDEAVAVAQSACAYGPALLKCSSAYPAPPREMNLRTIPHLAKAFNVPVGLSDHTTGIATAVAAVALGACIVEKHITLSRAEPGLDAAFSLEPHEFKTMVEAVRVAESALGSVCYGCADSESGSRKFRRSLFITRDMHAGDTLTAETFRSIRPADGLAPKYYDDLIGRRVSRDVERGTPLKWELIL